MHTYQKPRFLIISKSFGVQLNSRDYMPFVIGEVDSEKEALEYVQKHPGNLDFVSGDRINTMLILITWVD